VVTIAFDPLRRGIPHERRHGDRDDETPESADELRDLSYRQLQSVAKKVGVKANLSRDELTTKVADELGFDAEA